MWDIEELTLLKIPTTGTSRTNMVARDTTEHIGLLNLILIFLVILVITAGRRAWGADFISGRWILVCSGQLIRI